MRLVRVIAKLERGGAQLAALRLTRVRGEAGYQTVVLAGEATADGVRIFEGAGVPVESFGGEAMQYALDPDFAAWLAPRLQGADLVHAHMVGGWVAAATVVPDGVPLAASEHNAIQWPSGAIPWERLREAAARIDRFFAHGPAAARFARELGIAADRLREGRSPIPVPVARPQPEIPRGHVVFAGRLHPEKGPDVLVQAAARLPVPRPAVVLLGSGPIEPELRRQIQQLELGATVRLAGWQARPQDWIGPAAACAVPSRFDAWSQTAVLAMALGVPVVAAAVEGLPDLAAHGRAILVAPEDPDALAAALADVLAGRRVTDLGAARRYARAFTPPRVAAHYRREYEAMLRAYASLPFEKTAATVSSRIFRSSQGDQFSM